MQPIGFVILVNPRSPLEQSEGLIRTLNRMFDYPPIACHHDFSQNPRVIEDLPANVRVVRDYVDTKWADFSCIEAAIRALRLLYSGDNSPDWFVYLSGADYPIKPAARILNDLQSSRFDAHLEHILVDRMAPPHSPPEHRLKGHKGSAWPRLCHGRYCSIPITVPWITRRLQFETRILHLEHPLFTSGKIPFSPTFRCFGGEAWFCANRRAADVIFDSYTHNTKLVTHYRNVVCPEESYFHTVLANAPDLHLCQDPLRYMDWTSGGNHPKVLTVEDLPRLAESNAHFARKLPEVIPLELLRGLGYLTQ